MATVDGKLVNGDSEAFWAGVAEGKLLFQKCRSCGDVQFPPRHQCASCWDDALDMTESSGAGTIESATVVRRAPVPAFRDRVPYVAAAVRLDDGPRMITNVVGPDALDARIDDRVRVAFVEDGNGHVLPQFELARG